MITTDQHPDDRYSRTDMSPRVYAVLHEPADGYLEFRGGARVPATASLLGLLAAGYPVPWWLRRDGVADCRARDIASLIARDEIRDAAPASFRILRQSAKEEHEQ